MASPRKANASGLSCAMLEVLLDEFRLAAAAACTVLLPDIRLVDVTELAAGGERMCCATRGRWDEHRL
jgi:hypothetical protein